MVRDNQRFVDRAVAIIRVIVAATPLALAATALQAGPFEDGVAAYERGDYASAIGLWHPLAQQGDAAAQFNIALLLNTGRGVPEDKAAAVSWYRLAAEQGYAKAQFSLGAMYERGDGVPQDYAEAAKWYRAAAEQRNARARYKLGYLHHKGKGVQRDLGEAVKLYSQAADQGLPEAQFRLGILYALGEGVQQDYVVAHAWLDLAAANSQDGAVRTRAVESRDILARKMAPEQISAAKELAQEWKPKVTP
jgi:TPR repeat protein